MTAKLIDILQNIPDKPGIYQIIGRNPINPIHGGEICLYVGQSGQTKWEKPKSQGLQGRIARHLKNDAGELFSVVKDINMISRIDYWVLDISKGSPFRNFILEVSEREGRPANDVFKEFLNAFENLVKSREEIWHTMFLDRKKRGKKKYTPLIENKLLSIFRNDKQSLEFKIQNWLIKEEKEFRDSFNLLVSDACREIFETRNYQSLNKHLELLLSKWNIFKMSFQDSKPRNLYWTKFWVEE